MLSFCFLFLLIFPAFAASGDYVRTANYYLLSGSALDSQATVSTLASYDLIVIPSEAQSYNPSFFPAVRALNPDILILAYVPTVSWNNAYWSDPLHTKMKKGIREDWWLRDANGNKTSIWPNTNALDLNSGWTDYLADFVETNVMATGDWDGIFYDEVMDRSDWRDGYAHLFSITRRKLGNDAFVITNGSSDSAFAPYVNGRMFETFPSSGDGAAAWDASMRDYFSLASKVGHDAVIVVNVNTENTGTREDYQKMRFGLTATLLGDGYFSFDYGTENHAQLWRYDEEDVALGSPKGSAETESSVWTRDYERGKVVVNPTNVPQTIRLGGEYEKIHGTQDPETNDGSIVSRVTIGAEDGLVLLRPLEDIYRATYLNGAFARIFHADGATKRTGFFAYNALGKGGTRINVSDLDGDGTNETVVADDTYITIYANDGSVRAKFAPYTEAYRQGVNVAVDDLENDGTMELVTGTENGGGAQIRIFNANGTLINPGFFAYDRAFRGGVNVAVGDLNGDGTDEIVTGPGKGGGPHVRVFDKNGTLASQFFAFDQSGNDGVELTVSDLDGDGYDEVVGLSSEVFTLSFR